MGTSAFAVPTLSRLFDEGFAIAGVITQPDKPSGRGQAMHSPPVKVRALELQLPVHQPDRLKNDDARALLQSLAPDMIVVVAYGKILPPWMLALPRYGAINLHGSLLPKYRGAAPIHWAVANGESETGVCTMQVEEGLDTGPVYLSAKTEIDPDETVPQLSTRLATMGTDLVVQTVRGLVAGALTSTPQDHAIATLAPILKKSDGIVNWSQTAAAIHNRVRAFNPWPGSVTVFRGVPCKILKTRVDTRSAAPEAGGVPGEVRFEKRALKVCCGEGSVLEVLELQPQNRKPVSGSDFANGARLQPGEKFERLEDNESS